MTGRADFERSETGGGSLRFTGNLSLAEIGDLPERLDAIQGPMARIDVSAVDRIDTVGAWLLHRFARDHGATVEGMGPDEQHLFDQVAAAEQPVALPPRSGDPFTNLLADLGGQVMVAWHTLYGLLGFLGATLIAFANVAIHPRRFRFDATVHRFEVVGVSALWIIGLMSFLIGIVIAQQGAVQLRQFGAEIYTDQPGRPPLAARTRRADDRDHGRRPIGIGVRRADRHDEADRGDRRDAHDRRVADGGAGGAAHAGGGADDAAARLLRRLAVDHRRRAALLDLARHPADHLHRSASAT